MKILTKSNFINYLYNNNACQSNLDWAEKQVEARDIVEKCPVVEWLNWLIKSIGGSVLNEYQNRVSAIKDEYGEIWIEYEDRCDSVVKELCTWELVSNELGN